MNNQELLNAIDRQEETETAAADNAAADENALLACVFG